MIEMYRRIIIRKLIPSFVYISVVFEYFSKWHHRNVEPTEQAVERYYLVFSMMCLLPNSLNF
jgi:hypothetical protein